MHKHKCTLTSTQIQRQSSETIIHIQQCCPSKLAATPRRNARHTHEHTPLFACLYLAAEACQSNEAPDCHTDRQTTVVVGPVLCCTVQAQCRLVVHKCVGDSSVRPTVSSMFVILSRLTDVVSLKLTSLRDQTPHTFCSTVGRLGETRTRH